MKGIRARIHSMSVRTRADVATACCVPGLLVGAASLPATRSRYLPHVARAVQPDVCNRGWDWHSGGRRSNSSSNNTGTSSAPAATRRSQALNEHSCTN